jgi:TP901 family phage tail tape measure protein
MLLPPVLAEVRVKADQAVAELGKVNAAFATTALKTGESSAAMGKAFQASSKVVTLGVLGAAAVVGTVSLKMAADFQSHMTLLQTAGGESAKNMQVVSSGILDLAGATGTSIDQLSQGMYTVEKAGIRGADGLLVLKAAAEGAKAENVDLSTATNALTSVMMSYHMKAADAVKVQNELVAGSGMAKTTMSEYAGSLSAVIPVASAAGISFDQVAGAIATLTQHGTSAQESTQELANTIRALQNPNAVAVKMMGQLGLSSVDVAQHLGQRGLTGTIQLVSEAIAKNMGPSGLVMLDAFKKSQIASGDLQTELGKMPASLRALSQEYLNGQLTSKGYTKEVNTMKGQAGVLGHQFLTLAKQSMGFNDMLKTGNPSAITFSGALAKVTGGATGMNTALMLGGANMAYFQKATKDVSEAAKKGGSDISTWAQTQKTFNVQMSQVKEGVNAFAVRIGTALMPVVQQAVGAIQQWASWLDKNRAVLYTIVGAVGAVVGGMMAYYVISKTITAATIAYNVVAGLFGIVTKAGAAASYGQAGATYANVAAQKAYAVGAGIAKVATMAWVGVQWLLNAAMDANPVGIIIMAIVALIAIIILVATHWKQVTAFLTGMWKNVGSFFMTVGNAIASWWNGFWSGLVHLVQAVVANVVSWVKANWGLLLSLIIGPLGLIIQWVVNNWGGIVKFFTGVFNAVAGVFRTVGAVLWKIVQVIFGLIVGTAVILFGPFVKWFTSTWQTAVRGFQIIGEALGRWWNTLWTGITAWLTATFGPIINWLVNVWKTEMAGFTLIGNTLSKWWNDLWTGIVSWVSTTFGPGIQWVTDTWTKVQVGMVIIGTVLSKWWSGFWGGITSTVSSIWGGVSSFVGSVWSNITGFFTAAGSIISSAWNSMWSGLTSTVSSIFGGVVDIVKGIINTIIGVINGAIDGINGITGAAAAVGVKVPKLGHIPSLDAGGYVPGGVGQPTLALNHGGEYMLSVDMLSGRKQVAPAVAQAVAQNQAAFGGASAPASSRKTGRGGGRSITVNAQTNATAQQIVNEISWWSLRNG